MLYKLLKYLEISYLSNRCSTDITEGSVKLFGLFYVVQPLTSLPTSALKDSFNYHMGLLVALLRVT